MYFRNFGRFEISNKNKELQKAINERDCDKVKTLLSGGANINHHLNKCHDTMLHTATNAGIAYDLLGYSANINAKNLSLKTPLHTAAESGKSPEFVRALLAHGPAIDIVDREGKTPLIHAVERPDKNYGVIKELVLAGASISDVKWDWKRVRSTALDTAVLADDVECAKVLIKYCTVTVNNPNLSSINLTTYFRCSSYPALITYLDACCKELSRMKRDVVIEKTNTTMHQVVLQKFVCRDVLGIDDDSVNELTEKCLGKVKSNSYPIYSDVIMDKLKIRLEKKGLVNKLKSVQIYTNVGQGKIVLNSDSVQALSRFLPRNDLFNFVVAYYLPSKDLVKGQSINNVSRKREVNKRPCEPSTSYSCAKFIKFE